MLLEHWNDVHVYQYTTGYDLHWRNYDFSWNAPQNDWIQSRQVWVSGHKRYWNDEMTSMFINTPPDMICIDVMSTLRGMPSNDWIESAGMNFRLSTLSEYSNGSYIHECTTRYYRHRCNVDFTRNAPQKFWTHSQQVWVSGYKCYWNIETTFMFINAPPDMICIGVFSTLRGMPLKMIG